jgi:hypothetical protein
VETNLSTSDGFYFIVSYDGGTTFLSDATNYDTYAEVSTLAFQYPVGTQIFTGGSDLGGAPAPDAWRAHIRDPVRLVVYRLLLTHLITTWKSLQVIITSTLKR